MEDLPSGWTRLPLNDLCVRVAERVLPEDAGLLPYVGLEHIDRGSHRLKGQGDARQTTSFKSLFRVGDVLYGRLRPNLNKVIVAPFAGICSTDILVLRSTPLLDPRYLLLLLSTRDFIDYAVARAKGVNLPRLSVEALMNYAVAIPPIAEQRRIIETLDVAMAGLRGIEERLASTARQVDALPAKILASATRGQLTRAWRAKLKPNEAGSGSQAEFADGSGLLPKGWSSRRIEALGSVRKGRVRTPQHHQGPNMRPYLRVANVYEARIDLTDVMTMNFTAEEFERFRLKSGDILLNEGQSLNLVGRPAMFQDELEEVCFTNSLIRFRCSELVLPEFALLVFRHYLHADVFSRVAKITTNLAHLGAQRFAALPFPLAPLDEQREIANVAGTHLDKVAHIVHRLAGLNGILRSLIETLRTDALAGRLVRQDPAERPASTALEDYARLAAAQHRPTLRPVRRKGSSMREIRPVIDAMRAAAKPLTGQQLFAAAGYPEDAPSELVERFYLDLREQIAAGRIAPRQTMGADTFAAAQGEVLQ